MRNRVIRSLALMLACGGLMFSVSCGGDNRFHDSEAPVKLTLSLEGLQNIASNVADPCHDWVNLVIEVEAVSQGTDATEFTRVIIRDILIYFDNVNASDDIQGFNVPRSHSLRIDRPMNIGDSFTLQDLDIIPYGLKLEPPLNGGGVGVPLNLNAHVVVSGRMDHDSSIVVTQEMAFSAFAANEGPTPDLDGDTCPDIDEDAEQCEIAIPCQ